MFVYFTYRLIILFLYHLKQTPIYHSFLFPIFIPIPLSRPLLPIPSSSYPHPFSLPLTLQVTPYSHSSSHHLTHYFTLTLTYVLPLPHPSLHTLSPPYQSLCPTHHTLFSPFLPSSHPSPLAGSSFRVGNEASDYPVYLGTFTGNTTDAFSYHQGRSFSTKDRDNDLFSSGNCAKQFTGGWWYDR